MIRAILSELCTFSEMEQLVQSTPGFTMSRTSFAKGRSDFKILAAGGELLVNPRSVLRYQSASVDAAIAFILSSENVSYLSWGAKKVVVDGKAHILPSITRKRAVKHIYDAYVEADRTSYTETGTISRAAFYRVVAVLTAGRVELRRAIDYVTGFLVNDCFAVMDRIAQDFIANGEIREQFLKRMEAARAFLKYGFGNKAREGNESCILHNHYYGLDLFSDRAISVEMRCCEGCAYVLGLYAVLVDHLSATSAPASAIQVVNDCALKCRLFLGHRLRVSNQQNQISRVIVEMHNFCIENKGSSEALVVLDFKMKLEPMHYREKTVEHYGKRGISWHGAMIHFFTWEDDLVSPRAAENRVYVDHISDGDSKQDREAVVSVIEAILMRIRKDLPHISTIVLQSGNASCYQNALVVLMLPHLSVAHGIRISRFIHTETQDGKSVLDAHFARSMGVLKLWLREGNNCVTPTQAVIGLKSHGGLPNCIVEVVEHDRATLERLVAEAKPLEKKFKTLVKRVNDVHLNFDQQLHSSPSAAFTYHSCPDFTVTAFAYSGVEDGIRIRCQPQTSHCRLQFDVSNQLSGTTTTDVQDSDDDPDSECEFDFNPTSGTNTAEDPIVSDGDDVDEEVLDSAQISAQFATGPVTGIQVATQGQLQIRTRRWRRPAPTELNTDVETSATGSKDIVSYAVRSALQLQTLQQALRLQEEGQLSTIGSLESQSRDAENISLLSRDSFPAGWAIRPRNGQMYGRKYIGDFKDDVCALFEQGEKQKSTKMGPGRMLEVLKRMHPNRFDLPFESEIRQEIAKLMKRKVDQQVFASASRATNDFPATAIQFSEALLESNPATTPKFGLAAYRQVFHSDNLSDEQVKKKFSKLKAARKRAKQMENE